jgi:hypothetical protein
MTCLRKPRADGGLSARWRLRGLSPADLGDIGAAGLGFASIDGRDVLMVRQGQDVMPLGDAAQARADCAGLARCAGTTRSPIARRRRRAERCFA